ncbi:tetratricopeptide repeat-containing sensor histidine kinase [Flavobacterium hungaricum]|uniref:tetratricopeptide repeat-containing sensor histidine kinase n=1 Tax=Flavobacterium hungaricum TaxID=2082725 RepID=UPI0018841917|nr:sensor histidine kinase [Flavobacterium hungaricum]
MITKKITDLLDHGAEFLYRPDSFKIDLDSARSNFNKAFVLSHRINDENLKHKCLFFYGELLFEENNYPKALEFYQKAMVFYQKTKQYKKEADLWAKQGKRLFWQFPRNFKSFDEAVICFDKAAALYKNLGLFEDYAYLVKYKADAHLNQGRLDLAEKELFQALGIYKKIGYKKLQYTYDLLADVNRLKGDLGKSLYYSLACVKYMEATKEFGDAPDFYEQLALAYKDLGKHDLSIELLAKAIPILKSQKELDYTNIYAFTDLLCKELIEIKKPKEALRQVQNIIKEYAPKKNTDKAIIYGSLAYCYNKNKQPRLAEANFAKMITLYEESNSIMDIDLSEAYFEFGKFYEEHQNYDKAKVNFQKSLNFPKGIVELSQVKEANLYLFKIDSAKGNYITAIQYFQKYKNLNDSIFNEKKNKQIEELQILYGLEKKEKEFSNLKLDMDAEKQKTIHAQTTIKFGFCLVAFLLVSIILFWISYQEKKKNNALLITQKNEIDQKNETLQKLVIEKESLMQEIHHRVKNNLQIVMSLLNSQSSTLKNKEAFDAIQKSQHRLYAISLLHQKLYRTDIIREIEMENYINDLLHNFRDTFDMHYITFETALDTVHLDEAQAVSVGLILNEAITNAIKYAFESNQKGIIVIEMKPSENNTITLKIRDNGNGFPDDLDFNSPATLGINLISGLAQQLDGKVSFFNDNGAVIQVEFTANTITRWG